MIINYFYLNKMTFHEIIYELNFDNLPILIVIQSNCQLFEWIVNKLFILFIIMVSSHLTILMFLSKNYLLNFFKYCYHHNL